MQSIVSSINSIFNIQMLSEMFYSLSTSIHQLAINKWNPNERMQLFLFGPDFIANMFWIFNVIGVFLFTLLVMLLLSKKWKKAQQIKDKMMEFGYLRLLSIFSSFIIICSVVHIKHRNQEEHWNYNAEAIPKLYLIMSDVFAVLFLVMLLPRLYLHSSQL